MTVRDWDGEYDGWGDCESTENYGPIMVQQLFPSALNAPMKAIRVAWFQLVTSKWGAVTAGGRGFDHISEILEGDAPHRPCGCVTQAWSVAEVLRANMEDVKGVKPIPAQHKMPRSRPQTNLMLQAPL